MELDGISESEKSGNSKWYVCALSYENLSDKAKHF